MDSIASVAEQNASGAQQLAASAEQQSAATQQVTAAGEQLQNLSQGLGALAGLHVGSGGDGGMSREVRERIRDFRMKRQERREAETHKPLAHHELPAHSVKMPKHVVTDEPERKPVKEKSGWEEGESKGKTNQHKKGS